MAKALIKDHNGSPAIFIDGKPYPPMTALIRCRKFETTVIDEEYYRQLGRSGIKIFYIVCDTLWIADDAVEKFREECEILLRAVPDAYVIPRVSLHPPLRWLRENPSEIVSYSDGRKIPTLLYMETFKWEMDGMYSLCSRKWREAAGKALREIITELDKLPFADRIVGYFLCAGGTSEWYYINPIEDFKAGAYADTSPAFKEQFEDFLQEKYGENAPEPTIPTCEDRFYAEEIDRVIANPGRIYASDPAPAPVKRRGHIGSFIDADTNMHTADFYRAWHLGTADSINYFGKIIKEMDPYKIVGAFYGAWGWSETVWASTAGGVLRILDAPYVDALANPGVYENRQPGGFTGQRQMPDSYRLRNKIYIVEEDTRTHAENTHFGELAEMFTIEDTINVLKRDFGRNVCEDLQAWWFDQHIGGGRYKYPEVYSLFERQQQISELAYSLDRRKNSEIAFIYDEESIHAVSKQTTVECVELVRGYEIARIGAPVDQYYHNDMADPKMPSYKLYVFCNVFSLTDKEREVIKDKLRRDKAHALFLYAPGIINPEGKKKLSAENVTDLTGIKCRMETDVKVSPAFRSCSGLLGLEENRIYGLFDRTERNNISFVIRHGKRSYLYPAIYSADEEATVVGRFCQNGEPALTVKENDGYTSVLYGAKFIRAEVIREVARLAGCHIYEEDGNVLYVNRHFLTIHALRSGEVHISLPKRATVTELYSNEFVACDK